MCHFATVAHTRTMLSGRSANNSKHAFSPYTFISSARFFLIFSGARGDNAPVFFLSVYNSTPVLFTVTFTAPLSPFALFNESSAILVLSLLAVGSHEKVCDHPVFIKVRSISLTFFIITTIIKATFFVIKCTFWATLLKRFGGIRFGMMVCVNCS